MFWAADAERGQRATSPIVAARIGARTVVKSKSMATEEIGLNDALEADGRRGGRDRPGRVDHPARRRDAVPHHRPGHPPRPRRRRRHLRRSPPRRRPVERARGARAPSPASELRAEVPAGRHRHLRRATSAWPRPARSCSSPTRATAAWCTSLPRVHVAVMGMERVVDDLGAARPDAHPAAPGRHRPGPQRLHDARSPARAGRARSTAPTSCTSSSSTTAAPSCIGSELQEMLNCIRCGACLNVCPVYRQVGGHAYGWVYSGPMGAVLTPLLNRGRGGGRAAGRVDAVRRLHGRVPGEDPAAGPAADAAPARRPKHAGRAERAGVEGVGGGVEPAAGLPGQDPRRGGGVARRAARVGAWAVERLPHVPRAPGGSTSGPGSSRAEADGPVRVPGAGAHVCRAGLPGTCRTRWCRSSG